ncbi:hypothetical protein TRFO_33854 [Tritrichomonas foetus]|uniref:Uncharacterized protein n=1 Tax=Tritrichomonas foetus TaxID=1144522 RepID=A0A1J4JLR0_9EUKA|nr:hypothetical protein TRFO_33854 [Tritrichomonas foetus]|eukprot:OHS99625.1 hypothetical protein TRFO_33854 [Tritrichomonas foetus]
MVLLFIIHYGLKIELELFKNLSGLLQNSLFQLLTYTKMLGGYSNSYTPVSSSSPPHPNYVTPKNRVVNPYVYQTPPLFSKAEQIGITQRKNQLEIEIASMKKRLKILQEQSSQVKSNAISIGELTQLKASIQSNLSTTNEKTLVSLMNEYIGIIHDNCELTATCAILTKLIKKGSNKRQKELEMSNQIAEAMDFSSITKVIFPDISKNIDLQRDSLIKTEILQLQNKLDGLKQELIKLDVATPATSLFCEAAGSYTRKTETEWQVRAIGTAQLRTQIQNLQRQIVDSSAFLKKIQDKIADEQAKLTLVKVKSSEAESKARSNNEANTINFKTQLSDMDQTISHLNQEIGISAEKYEKLEKELNDLANKKRYGFENDKEDEMGDNSDEDNEDENYEIDKLHVLDSPFNKNKKVSFDELTVKKAALEKEVQELRTKYSKRKASIKKKEASLKSQINILSDQYNANRKFLSQKSALYDQRNDSLLEKQMTSLMKKIDSSIMELQSEYA